ncbi:MAG: TRAP transporter substrate-binding protein DctP [Alphaproteobacteria bacterium]
MIITNASILRLTSAVVLAFALSCGGTASSAKDLTISLGLGPKHPVPDAGYGAFNSVVERETNKDLVPKMFLSGALLSIKASLAGLKDGIADVSQIVYSNHPAELRALQVITELSNLGKENAATAGASTEFAMLQCAPCQAEMAANGVVQLSGHAGPPYAIISKAKVTSLADIAGKKIRSGGGSFSQWVRYVGATDVSMPTDDMYQAFTSGVIDIGIQTPVSVRTLGFWDVSKHITELPIGIISGVSAFSVSQRTWRGMTPAERTALVKGASAGINAIIKAYDIESASIYGPAKEKGVQFHQPDGDLLEKTRQFDKEHMKNVAGLLKEKYNVQDADRLVAVYAQLIDKWSTLMAPIKTDYVAIQAMFNREIYSKIDASRWGL